MNYSIKVDNIVKNLADEESRDWFEARLKYIITRNPFEFYPCIYQYCQSFYGGDIAALSKTDYVRKKFIIFGTGKNCYHMYEILKRSSLKDNLIAFCDRDVHNDGKVIDGLPVISIFDLDEKQKEAVFIVSSTDNGKEDYHLLSRIGIPQSNIYYPPYNGRLLAATGKQYFDLFESNNKEIFIDAGCYDGETSVEFTRWCSNNYEKIYAFEPSESLLNLCKRNFLNAGISAVELVDKVCWSKAGSVNFATGNQLEVFGAAHVQATSGVELRTESIDNLLDGKQATFIKMDIEGSELEALKGAQKTIKKWRPKLAISIYHKHDDIIELPAYLLSLIEDYQLYIRHYSSDVWETVLYAI